MLLPKISGAAKLPRKFLRQFGGLNRTAEAADNEFSGMENFCSDSFPQLTTCGGNRLAYETVLSAAAPDHEELSHYDAPTGIQTDLEAKTAIFYYRGESLSKLTDGSDDAYQPQNYRQLLQFNNYYIAFPFPFYFLPKKDAGGKFSVNGSSLMLEKLFSTESMESTTSTSAFVFRNGSMQFNGDVAFLKPLKELFTQGKLAVGSRVYLKINHQDANPNAFQFIIRSFSIGASTYYSNVYFDVFDSEGNAVDMVKQTISAELRDVKGLLTLYKLKNDATIGEVHQGRIFGTDTFGDSLYCSSYSDFKNWDITATADGGGFVQVSSPGKWTGLKSCGGYLYAFKADKLYRIAGTTALNYRADLVSDIGALCQKGICVYDSTLYYLGRDGIYAFTGTEPALLSRPLGKTYTGGAIAGMNGKLYCSLTAEDGCEFVVYDIRRRIWHRESTLDVVDFVPYGGALYGATPDGCFQLGEGTGEALPFVLETKEYFNGFDQKGVSEVWLSVDATPGTELSVSISYNNGPFELCGTPARPTGRIPVRLKKCDSFRLRLAGSGKMTLKALEFSLYTGGRDFRSQKG